MTVIKRNVELRPLDPIFQPRIRRGAVDVGNTPGAVLVPQLSIIGSDSVSNATNNRDIIVVGDYAYFVSSPSGNDWFHAINCTDRANPVHTNSFQNNTLMDDPYALAWNGGSYVIGTASFGDRMFSVSISSPGSPSLTQSVQNTALMDRPNGIALQGAWAFAGCSDDHAVAAVNVSNPTSMAISYRFVDAVNLNTAVGCAPLGADYIAVCAQGTARVTVVDISNPASMFVAGVVIDGVRLNGARWIRIVGSLGFVTGLNQDYLTIIDLSDPTDPKVLQSVTGLSPTNQGGLALVGNAVFVAETAVSSISAIDITNPATASVVSTLTDASLSNIANLAMIDSTHLICAVNNGVVTLEIGYGP